MTIVKHSELFPDVALALRDTRSVEAPYLGVAGVYVEDGDGIVHFHRGARIERTEKLPLPDNAPGTRNVSPDAFLEGWLSWQAGSWRGDNPFRNYPGRAEDMRLWFAGFDARAVARG